MKFLGQYIQDFVSRFRNDVYLEDISTGTIASGGNLGLDSNNKIVKANVPADGDITGVSFRSDDGVTAGFTSGSADFVLVGSTGIKTTSDGSATLTLAAHWIDNEALTIGTGNDFTATHNGTDTYLGNNTGDLYITQQADDKDIIFRCDDGSGGVETYFFLDGSYGANPYTIFPDNSTLALGSNRDLLLVHDATDSKIDNYVGDLKIRNFADDKDIVFESDNGSGGTAAYLTLDGSTTHSYFSAGNVGIGTTSPGELFEVYKNGGDVAIKVHEDAGTHEAKIHLRRGGSDWELINNNDLAIESEGTELFRIKTTGNIGIGTTSPGNKLEVHSGTTNVAAVFKSSDNQAWISVHDDDSGTYGALFGTDSDEGHHIVLADRSANKRLVVDSSGNVGIGVTSPDVKFHVSGDTKFDNAYVLDSIKHSGDSDTQIKFTTDTIGFDTAGSERLTIKSDGDIGVGTTSPGEKLEVSGNIKLSGNLDIGGSVQKQIQVFPMNFVDDLGTDKHFMPFVTNVEQTANYQEEACMVMPADGRVVSVTVHYAQMHGSDGNITIGIETSACGQSYTNAWTVEETAVLPATVADDHHVFHFAFDNAKHFDSTDKMAISIQQSAAMQNANRFFWVTAVVEYDWSTFLAGSNPGQEYTTTP